MTPIGYVRLTTFECFGTFKLCGRCFESKKKKIIFFKRNFLRVLENLWFHHEYDICG